MKNKAISILALTKKVFLAGIAAFVVANGLAHADVNEVHIGSGFGMQYLPLYVMKHYKLMEKHSKENGLHNMKVSWHQFSGGAALNDALLSGAVDMVESGVGPLGIIWAKTEGNINVRAITAMGDIPMTLITNDPDVKTTKDILGSGKVAVPAVKASMQAVLIQMIAANLYGQNNYARLDKQTVTMKHSDAAVALLSKSSAISMHFSVPPYVNRELVDPSIHKITDSIEIIGSPMTLNTTYLKESFYRENPIVCKAYLAALKESMDFINQNKSAAAKLLIAKLKLKQTQQFVEEMLSAPGVDFTIIPHGTLKFVQFMHQVGLISKTPKTWKDLFFPIAYGMPGS